MPLVPLTDLDHPGLAPYVGLREAVLRRSTTCFIAEGELVIRRALAAGYDVESLLLSPRAADALADVLPPDVPVYVAAAGLVEELTGFHVHRGALAAVQRRPESAPEVVLRSASRVMVVEDVVDHANLGAIIRTAAGLGWDAVLVSHRSADPLYRRAVKASMGAVFAVPWARLPERVDLRTLLLGWRIAAMALTPGAATLDEFGASVGPTDRVALLLGTEGHGLSQGWLEQADQAVVIPMASGIDSLNVAAAGAVACYALRPFSPVPGSDRTPASG
jgi:tRNA G18 (ribose-2'-O)-methylase SpoU